MSTEETTPGIQDAILAELKEMIDAAAEVTKGVWQSARQASEQASQRNEAYRELASRAATAFDHLTRASSCAVKAMREMVDALAEKESPAE